MSVTVSSSSSIGSRGLLGLVMIVKDEARRIGDVLGAYLDSGTVDEATILDTGSTDGTQAVIRAAIGAGAPVRLFEEPFVDFSTSRNRALDLHADRTELVLMVNVDRVDDGAALRAFLEAHRDRTDLGAFRLRLRPGHYFQTSVLRPRAGWRFTGRTHEVAIGPGMGPIVPGVSVIVDRSERSAAGWASRWRRDLALLHQDASDRPGDPRPVFYLGQTHECLAMLPAAPGEDGGPAVDDVEIRRADLRSASTFYAIRSGMGGYRDEAYEAMFRHARVTAAMCALGPGPGSGSGSGLDREADHARVVMRYLAAHAFDPRRAEPLCALAEYLSGRGDHALAYMLSRRAAEIQLPDTDLFVDESAYTSRASDLAAVSAFYLRDVDPCAIQIGADHMRRAVAAAPDDPRIRHNLTFYEALGA